MSSAQVRLRSSQPLRGLGPPRRSTTTSKTTVRRPIPSLLTVAAAQFGSVDEATSTDVRLLDKKRPKSTTTTTSHCCSCDDDDAPATTTSLLSQQHEEQDNDNSTSNLWNLLRSSLKSSPYDASILSLALPAVLALAADPLLQVVDTVFVGQAGPDALAALGVNSALFTFSFVVFNFLATATTPLVATSLANGDTRRAGAVTAQALFLACVLGVGLAAALHAGADQALLVMGADPIASPEMFSLARDFLLIRAAAAPAALLITVGQGVYRGLKDMRTPLMITLGANGINLGLDILLIIGLGWGVKGAATATVTAEWTAAVAYLALLWTRREELGGASALRSGIAAPSLAAAGKEAAPFLAAGGAVLLRTAALLGTKTLASATAARLGPVPIASHQVVMQLWLLSSFVIDSLAVAGQTLIATELGRGDIPRARATGDRLLQIGVGSGLALALLFGLSSPYIPQIFTNDVDVSATIMQILPLAIAMLPVNAAVYVLDGILVGSSDFKWMAIAMAGSAAAAVGLLVGVEPLHVGLVGVWGALALLMTGRLGTLLWRYYSPTGPLSLETSTNKVGAVEAPSSLSSVKANVKPVKPPMETRYRNNVGVKNGDSGGGCDDERAVVIDQAGRNRNRNNKLEKL